MMARGENIHVESILELTSKGQLDKALALANTLDPAQTSDDQILAASRSLLQGIGDMQAGHYEAGILTSLPAISKLERHGYRPFLDWAYSPLGFSLGMLGTPEIGLEWVSKAITGAEQRTDESQLRRSLNDEGRLFAMLEEEERSIAAFEKVLALQDAAWNVFEEADFLNDIAHTYLHFARRTEQDFDKRTQLALKALELAQSALDMLKAQNHDHLTISSLENLGSALTILGRFPEAEEAFVRALPLSESNERIHVELLASYALLLCELGRYDEADSMLQRAYEQAQARNQEASFDHIIEARIRLEVMTGKNAEALLWSEQRLRLMESQYRKRLTTMTRNAEIFVELEKMRQVEQKARGRERELQAVNKVLEKQAQSWRDEALRDALTGCLNQRGLALFSEEWFTPGRQAACAMVDIDHFKSINDQLGHDTGDKVIQVVASIFVDALRGSDLVVRSGGEEFLLVIHGVENEAAWGTCERLRRAVERHGWGTIAPGLRVTVSLGVAVRGENEEFGALTARAKASLYQAKTEGRNRVVITG